MDICCFARVAAVVRGVGGWVGSSRLWGLEDVGVSENRGTLFGGPYNKDPTI